MSLSRRTLIKYTSCFSQRRNSKKPYFDLEMKNNDKKTKFVLVYGGGCQLGSKCIYQFKSLPNWWVGCIDSTANTHADVSIILTPEEKLENQEAEILSSLEVALSGNKLDAIYYITNECRCSEQTGNDLANIVDSIWNKNIAHSIICSTVAVKFLEPGGLLVFTGSKSVNYTQEETLAYAAEDTSIYQLAKSLASKESGLPRKSKVILLLPTVLDTPLTRNSSPDADAGNYTPLVFVSNLLVNWATGTDVPTNGTIRRITTVNFKTEILPVD